MLGHELYRSFLNPLHRVISSESALREIAARLADAPAIGLDTEFLRERTYRAELCLVQLGNGEAEACLDPLAIQDLSPIAPLLASGNSVKIMHASRQDLEVLFPAVGLVRPVFDTQIAAALAGFPAQVGYAELVRRVLGIELSKAHTRTDWSQRPLSPEQIEYALDDVRFLLPLKTHLEEQLAQLGRTSWLAEELEALGDAGALTVDPDHAWLRIKGLRNLDPGRARLAATLAAWRERRAIDRNKPRGWILDDVALREIVQRVPRTIGALGAIPLVAPALLRHCGAELLAQVEAAEIPDPPPALVSTRPEASTSALVRKLSAINQATATELGISPEVLVTRRELEELAAGRRELGVLSGWRRASIGEKLLAAL